MASAFTHALAAAALAHVVVPGRTGLLLLGALCAAAPDLDVIGFRRERYFFPWQPIEVSPISVRRFFTARGWRVLQSELVVVWLPALVLVSLTSLYRSARRARGL